jgi:hypothetical protein
MRYVLSAKRRHRTVPKVIRDLLIQKLHLSYRYHPERLREIFKLSMATIRNVLKVNATLQAS